MSPGEDVEVVEQEHEADQGDPGGACGGAEETELVAGAPYSEWTEP